MRSKHTDETFRIAARKMCAELPGNRLSVGQWAAIDRPHGGGAFVEVLLWVPEERVAAVAQELKQKAGRS